ncbi:conserved hypothetical protein, partial [Ricinus communis]
VNALETAAMSVISKHIGKHKQTVQDWSAKSMYFSLLAPSGFSKGRADSLGFLAANLQETSHHFTNVPTHPAQLEAWLLEQHAAVGQQYQEYLAARKA